MKLYLVLDPNSLLGRNPETFLESSLRGGVTWIQLRDKGATDGDFEALARRLLPICRAYHAPFIINDRVEIARRIHADGVHLGQGDVAITDARRILGRGARIGLSVESLAQAVTGDATDADYLAASPVFSTSSKGDASAACGLPGLRAIRAVTRKPLVAIGGIHTGNASEVMRAGADGIAVISALATSPDPTAEAQILKEHVARGIADRRSHPPRILTIAGSDSGGGAGIQADIKTIEALGGYGMSAITAVTAQNTQHVSAIHTIPPGLVTAQIRAVIEDIGVDAIKIGMLPSREIIEAVATLLPPEVPVVLDPVMIAKSGHALLDSDAIAALRSLFPRATVLTPNLPEASALLGRPIRSRDEMPAAARALSAMGPQTVLLKGGHLEDELLVDHVYSRATDHSEARSFALETFRILTANTHGTGCTYSAAISAYLGGGLGVENSIRLAHHYLQDAIRGARSRQLGRGHGPLHHACIQVGYGAT